VEALPLKVTVLPGWGAVGEKLNAACKEPPVVVPELIVTLREPMALPQPLLVALTDLMPAVGQVTEIELPVELPEMVPSPTVQCHPVLDGVQLLALALKPLAWPTVPVLPPLTEIAGLLVVVPATLTSLATTMACSPVPRRTRRHGK
jgi:hypothetical protein